MSEKEMRELDAWIAENVLGWSYQDFPASKANLINVEVVWKGSRHWYTTSPCPNDPRHPSFKGMCPMFTVYPEPAMMVLEKCVEMCSILISRPHYHDEKKDMWTLRNGELGDVWVKSNTLPLAICLFAKKLFSQ